METELIKEEVVPRVLEWQISTVVKVKVETQNVKTFTLALPSWTPHRAGQHYDVRLTAPDGYQTQRSYSIASNPEQRGKIDLTVERLEDGEVSTYLHDVLIMGDQVELRGPIGGYFVWEASMGGPLLLVAGGSFGLGCIPTSPYHWFSCDIKGFWGLVDVFVAALVANQSTYLVTRKLAGKEY